MSTVAIAFAAAGLSADSFVAALGQGARHPRPGLARALGTGAIFGSIEALTPLLGWALGLAASRFVAAVDHWIAFALLAGVGLRMILHAGHAAPERARAHGLLALVAIAIGTSVDALAVGVSLALGGDDILPFVCAVGLTTAAMSAGGMLAGHLLGLRFGRAIEGLGGVGLIALGAGILLRHLAA